MRRTLEGAHKELIERGYLTGVSYEGRGIHQEVIYTFASRATNSKDELELVSRLSSYGVAQPVARKLVSLFGCEKVEERIARFEAILHAGYAPRNHAGFLVDVVRDEEGKYVDPEGFVSQSRKELAARVRARRDEKVAEEEERHQQELESEWAGLDPQARAAKAIRMLTLILGKHLPIRYFSGLAEAFEIEKMDPREVTEAALRAQLNRQMEPFVQQLMHTLDGLSRT